MNVPGAFLATWDPAAKSINVYDQGVWWGFNYKCDLPESGPLTIPLLIVMAILVLKSEQLRLARN